MANGNFGGGTGTQADPYLVEDVADLNAVRNYAANPGAYFKQTKTIDMNVAPYNASPGFDPIGPEANSTASEAYIFYDGNNFDIANLLIDRPGNVALFRYIYGKLKNIRVINCNVTGTNAAALCYNVAGINGAINDCHATGNVKGTEKAGGMVAIASSVVKNNSFDGKVTGRIVGGFVAETNVPYLGGTSIADVSENASHGEVNGIYGDIKEVIAGGFIGQALQGSVLNCNSHSAVIGTHALVNFFGNLLGGFVGSAKVSITKCKAYGNVQWSSSTAGSASLGGFVAKAQGSSVMVEIRQCAGLGGCYSNNSPVAGFIYDIAATLVFIYQCYSKGTLVGSLAYGFSLGFANDGVPNSGDSQISNCFSQNDIGPITGAVAGFCGQGLVLQCYFAGTVSTTNASKNGFTSDTRDVLDNCYWDEELSGIPTSKGGPKVFGETTANMKIQATFVGFDFSAIWITVSGEYPMLIWDYFPGAPSYLTMLNTRQLALIQATDFTNGVNDTGKIVASNADGTIDFSMLPLSSTPNPAANPAQYLVLVVINGEQKWTLETAVSVSGGVADKGRIVCLNADGKIDHSMIPAVGDPSIPTQSAEKTYMTLVDMKLESIKKIIDVSAGKPDASKIVCLNANGKIDPSLMP